MINLAASGTCITEKLPSGRESIVELKEIWNSSSLYVNEKYKSNNNNLQIKTNSEKEHSGVNKGNRNKKAFQIARELRSAGKTRDEAKDYIVKVWNPKNKLEMG